MRKVRRQGNSLVVSLPPQALEVCGLVEGSRVVVELDPELQRIIIKPYREGQGVDAEFANRVAGFIDRYRPALNALASNNDE